ncbi:MAG TPA: DUF5686 and carboxypeptidase regulatory-like domain-containing protein [Bacteroidales bacterium]|nr:DUF5686 and carboxypeptidase regulatory-like domain-containing protein [Bacteroidales bacterium]
MIRTLIVSLITSLSSVVSGQEITGIITDASGTPVPFATIYIKELQTGTSSNEQGAFRIRVEPGTYHLNFRSMGYTSQDKIVDVSDTAVELHITLLVQSYVIAGVTIRADDEDPAYAIMRKAIARAPGFLKQAESYTSEVYIKGTLKIIKIPRLLQKHSELNGKQPVEGQTYVNESYNKIRFKAPDHYEQEVISYNNSFPIADDDVPVMRIVSGSIYESQDGFYISPFAPNAFAHYNFKYEGLLQDGAWFIDKIRVIPKRKNKLLMSGYLYIVEDLWCLYSYDVMLNPPYTEMQIKQNYSPIKGNSYFPVSLNVQADLGFMGIKAKATYVTTFRYDSVVINPDFSQDQIKQAISTPVKKEEAEKDSVPENSKVVKIDQQLDELLQKEALSNHEMIRMQRLISRKAEILEKDTSKQPLEIVSNYKQIKNKNAFNKDSVYWDSIRPVPASEEEKISYSKVNDTVKKTDSTSAFVKVLKVAGFGNSSWAPKKTFHLYYPGLLRIKNIGFNPVDGWSVNQSLKAFWKTDSLHTLHFNIMAGYNINRESPFILAETDFNYNPLRRATINLKGGYAPQDFNEKSGTPLFINSLYNLFLKDNYKKFYQSTFAEINHQTDILNGLEWDLTLHFERAEPLLNHSNYSFFKPDESYAPNIPANKTVIANNLLAHRLFKMSNTLQYTPFYYYRIEHGRKYYVRTKWPTLLFRYSKGFPLQEDYSSFNMFEAGLKQHIDIYTVSDFNYSIMAGFFTNKKNLHFSSFRHFNTIQEPFTSKKFREAFYLLNNYEYSTSDRYAEAHLKYSSQFLLLKRLPWLSDHFWTENLFLNVLFTSEHYPYYEAGYSLGQLFFGGEVGIFTGFKGSNYIGTGVKASFKF